MIVFVLGSLLVALLSTFSRPIRNLLYLDFTSFCGVLLLKITLQVPSFGIERRTFASTLVWGGTILLSVV